MPPIPAANGWHDEQIDELFASLLGRGFEDVGFGKITEPISEILGESKSLLGVEMLKGFRVFG